jgi:dephospho-CoA kinase
VLDAPVLLEAGWATLCDVVVMVEAAQGVRLARAAKRGWSAAEFAQREAAQWPVERKRQEADVVIDNNGSQAELRDAVQAFWNEHIEL